MRAPLWVRKVEVTFTNPDTGGPSAPKTAELEATNEIVYGDRSLPRCRPERPAD